MSARHVLSAAIVAVAMAWWAPLAAVRAQSATLAIVGGFLIDGFGGPPLADSVVLIKRDQIVAVGEVGQLAVPNGTRVIDANGYTVMPGLIDAHVHLDILGHGDYPTWHDMVRANYAEVMERSAAQLLLHGVTTARDAGGELRASVQTRDRIQRGVIPGPRMLVSGGWIQNWPDDPIVQSLRTFSSLSYFGQIQMQMRVAPAATRQLVDAGGRIIMGTDSGTPGYFHSEAVWREAEALVRMAGLTPMEAIVASTKLAAQALGVNTGLIHPGRLADVILVRGNPLDSVLYLQNVERVIKGGVAYEPRTLSGTE